MVFHSANFLIFFVIVLILFFTFKRGRLPMLAVGNAVFYGAAGLDLLVIFFAVTVLTFIVMHAMRKPGRAWLFWVGIAINIGNLAYFKYTMFILQSIESLTGGWNPLQNVVPAEIVLPIGISFYTFQFISYLIDVRRGDIEPTKSFLKFWIYVSLFPQLVAGPIMRGDQLLPQLDDLATRRVRWEEVKYGLYLITVGLIKKVVLADSIAQWVNPLFAKGSELTGIEAWLAAYGFGFQIYFDFSAYSDMAMGLGYMIGIRLVVNFRFPYISGNPSEFWERWHITLSRWIRDYIYIPLGGNRRHPVRVQINLLLAMMISGLWHGAMWTFVLWGMVHGLLLIAYKGINVLLKQTLGRFSWFDAMRQSFPYRVVTVFIFYHIVTWTWVFFRAESIEQALYMTEIMWTVSWPALFTSSALLPVVALYMLHLLEFGLRSKEEVVSRWWHKFVPFPMRSVAYAAFVLLIFYFLKGETYEFIYFQF